jgi:hypothetical protein
MAQATFFVFSEAYLLVALFQVDDTQCQLNDLKSAYDSTERQLSRLQGELLSLKTGIYNDHGLL